MSSVNRFTKWNLPELSRAILISVCESCPVSFYKHVHTELNSSPVTNGGRRYNSQIAQIAIAFSLVNLGSEEVSF